MFINLRSKLAFISVAFFFIATPLIICLSFYTLYTLDSGKDGDSENVLGTTSPQIFAALPDKSPSTSIKLISSDARGDILKEYLTSYDSPLSPYAYYIVNIADEFNIDFRLITAIARQESNLCKFIPNNTYNCWGWGIHSRGTLGFNSYEDGIKTVTEGLSKDYLTKGYTTPDEIMKKYTPLSNGSWASAVNQFMQEME
jgi:hypothetical protein